MSKTKMTQIELNSIVEVLEMGMGRASESISTILNKKVKINSLSSHFENVSKINFDDFKESYIVSFKFKMGLTGDCIFLIKKTDLKAMLSILIDNNFDEEFEFDELSLNTSKVIVDKIVASSTSALSKFLSAEIETEDYDITPYDGKDSIEKILNTNNDSIISIDFSIEISSLLNSKFMLMFSKAATTIISEKFSKKIDEDDKSIKEKKKEEVEENKQFISADSENYNEMVKAVKMKDGSVDIQQTLFPDFSASSSISVDESTKDNENMKLLMDISLNVNIQLGKTQINLKEIMNFSKGTIISLEKQAGAPVDVIVNGQLIARGDVVVIDDNFGVRLTEIAGDNNFLIKKFK